MKRDPESEPRETMAGDQRLEHILNTAEEMFFAKGYRGVSIRDLAGAVGIQMSSLYYYFPSKDDILYRILKRHLEELLVVAEHAVGAPGPAATAAQKLRNLIRESVVYLIEDRLAAEVSATQGRELPAGQAAELSAFVKRYEGLHLQTVVEGIERGEFIATDAALATYLILGAQVRLSAWYQPGGRLTAAEVADTYSFLLVRGLLADPGSHAG